MPAVTADDPLVLPRIRPLVADDPQARAVRGVVPGLRAVEGAGFVVHRPFPGALPAELTDPFVLLDHMGPVVHEPGGATGAPWHPHRGFETVTYLIDGELAHHDTHGGGGVIRAGDTQWMTAGSGLLHDELPTEKLYTSGGEFHGVQLWVNLPRADKFLPPKYQAIEGRDLTLLASSDGGALIRVVAGDLDGHAGPGSTHTPIVYLHATVSPGAELVLPWPEAYNAFAFVLTGSGSAGSDRAPIGQHDLAVFGAGDRVAVRAADGVDEPLDVLVLGGLPIGEPIFQYGPFVMNDKAGIIQAVEDYQAGKLGVIPPGQEGPRSYAN